MYQGFYLFLKMRCKHGAKCRNYKNPVKIFFVKFALLES